MKTVNKLNTKRRPSLGPIETAEVQLQLARQGKAQTHVRNAIRALRELLPKSSCDGLRDILIDAQVDNELRNTVMCESHSGKRVLLVQGMFDLDELEGELYWERRES
jgi:hypothetical protein